MTDLRGFRIGAFDVTIVNDGSYAYPHPAAVFFADAPPGELDEALAGHGIRREEWEEYVSPYPGLLVETGEHVVLVDTGGGGMAPTTGKLPSALDRAGLDPGEVDVVVLTHGHADHIGGNLAGTGEPAFLNARYVIAREEWEFWTGGPDLSPLRVGEDLEGLLVQAAEANLAPLEGTVELTEGETEVVPGVTLRPAPGHTPGHTAVEVASEGERLLHAADTVLHPIHVERPEWTAAVDYDPERTVETRRRLLDRAGRDGDLVFAYHFPAPGLGRVTPSGDGWSWRPEYPTA